MDSSSPQLSEFERQWFDELERMKMEVVGGMGGESSLKSRTDMVSPSIYFQCSALAILTVSRDVALRSVQTTSSGNTRYGQSGIRTGTKVTTIQSSFGHRHVTTENYTEAGQRTVRTFPTSQISLPYTHPLYSLTCLFPQESLTGSCTFKSRRFGGEDGWHRDCMILYENLTCTPD